MEEPWKTNKQTKKTRAAAALHCYLFFFWKWMWCSAGRDEEENLHGILGSSSQFRNVKWKVFLFSAEVEKCATNTRGCDSVSVDGAVRPTVFFFFFCWGEINSSGGFKHRGGSRRHSADVPGHLNAENYLWIPGWVSVCAVAARSGQTTRVRELMRRERWPRRIIFQGSEPLC